MLFIRIVLVGWLGRAIAGQVVAAEGEAGRDGDPPAGAGDQTEPEPEADDEPEAVEALSDNAMTRAPLWIRLSAGIVAPVIGLLGLGAALIGLVATNTGWELPLVGEVSGEWPLGLLLLSVAIWAIWLLWQVPRWQAAAWRRSTELTEREIFDIENSSRATLGQILGGVAVLAGLIFAWQQLGNTSRTLEVSQEGQITDRFTRAVGQLGDEDLTIRLGGIYALERIARDSERDHETVMEILAAFARQRSAADLAAVSSGTPVATLAPGQVTTMMLPSVRDIPLDVDVVLKVISRRDSSRDGVECIDLSGLNLAGATLTGSDLDLTNICLRGADLRGAELRGVDFAGANLNRAMFSGANLDGANLSGALLTEAVFLGANLSQANLTGATLTRANLHQAQLQGTILHDALLNGTDLSGSSLLGTDFRGANMLGADLTGATMSGVDLRETTNLTVEQVDAAFLDGSSQLPSDIQATPDF